MGNAFGKNKKTQEEATPAPPAEETKVTDAPVAQEPEVSSVHIEVYE